jgi:hypothetical protein
MRLLPNSVHRCRRYPTKFNSGRDIPHRRQVDVTGHVDARLCVSHVFDVVAHDDCNDAAERSAYGAFARCGNPEGIGA